MRLFVAIWPPPDVADRLSTLPRPDHRSLRWTTRPQWHVTLRFLGEVAERDVGPLGDALSATASALPPREVELGPATTRLRAGTLVLPVDGVDDLGRAVTDATRAFGAPPPDRPFRGHLTVARGRGGRPVPGELAGERLEARWHVGSIALVRSELHPDGARYDDVETFPLGPWEA